MFKNRLKIVENLFCVSAVAPLIGRYCGTKIPPEIQSSSGLLSLSFHTDMAVAKDGFSARYNMTHKEVSDCECLFAVPTSLSFVCRSSHPLQLSPALPPLMLFPSRGSRSSLSLFCSLLREHAFSEAGSYCFLLNVN